MPCKLHRSAESSRARPVRWPPTEESVQEIEERWRQQVSEARQAGFLDGEQAASRRLAAIIDELMGMRAVLRRQAEADVIKLSLAVARRILRRELAADPEAMRAPIQAALERLESEEIRRIRVHPGQEQLLRGCLGRTAEIVPDAALPCGAVLFETGLGCLDASLETQLEEIEQGLLETAGR